MDQPTRILELTIEPRTSPGTEAIQVSVNRLCADMASLTACLDRRSAKIILFGTSETQLEAGARHLRHDLSTPCAIGKIQMGCRETITRVSDIDYTHKKQIGGAGEFARIRMRYEPLPGGSGFEFKSEVVGDSVPTKYVPAIENSTRTALAHGAVARCPVIDFRAVLCDGAYHEIDSSVAAFEIAASAAFKEGIVKAGPKVLEPVMRLEVLTPEAYLGDVVADLQSRHGVVMTMDRGDNAHAITAKVRLTSMFGYAAALKAMTDGTGRWSMRFEEYAPISSDAPDPNDPSFPGEAAARVA